MSSWKQSHLKRLKTQLHSRSCLLKSTWFIFDSKSNLPCLVTEMISRSAHLYSALILCECFCSGWRERIGKFRWVAVRSQQKETVAVKERRKQHLVKGRKTESARDTGREINTRKKHEEHERREKADKCPGARPAGSEVDSLRGIRMVKAAVGPQSSASSGCRAPKGQLDKRHTVNDWNQNITL